MLILLNSTKTMTAARARPAGRRATRPRFQAVADELAARLGVLPRHKLAAVMGLSPPLADEVRAAFAAWGRDAAGTPALLAFTGLVFKHLEPADLTAEQWTSAQRRVRILSGLYGVLRARDAVAAYRLEMGCRYVPPGARNLADFWWEPVTSELNRALGRGEPVLNLASQEYLKALDVRSLKGPVVSPVFRERRADGSLKNVPVHAKMARGALARQALLTGAATPAALPDPAVCGFEPESAPPTAGVWLFTRPARD